MFKIAVCDTLRKEDLIMDFQSRFERHQQKPHSSDYQSLVLVSEQAR